MELKKMQSLQKYRNEVKEKMDAWRKSDLGLLETAIMEIIDKHNKTNPKHPIVKADINVFVGSMSKHEIPKVDINALDYEERHFSYEF
jgi:hypothetical protein